MTLQLNDSILTYQEFYGPNTVQMPKLLAEGRVPLSVLGVLEGRVAVRNSSEDVRRAWYENYFDTGDGIAYHPSGKFKIVLDAPPILDINPQSPLRNGALILDEDTYRALGGYEFSNDDRECFGRSLTERQALTHEGLRYLLRGTENAERIIPAIFKIGKDAYDLTNMMMRFYISVAPTASPEMRAWVVNRISGRSVLDGDLVLDINNGRLVGVEPVRLVTGSGLGCNIGCND